MRPARRSALQASGAAIVTALAGCLGSANVGSTPDPATVAVGPDDELRFAPGTDDPLVVDTGRTVRFEWASDDHNIVVASTPAGADWDGTGDEGLYDAGHVHEHTFETAGVYEFYCEPHRAAGMVGRAYVGVTPTPTATGREESPTGTPEPRERVEPPADVDAVVDVGPGGELAFDPEELRVESGTRVAFVWQSDNHNVVVDNQPQAGDWAGTGDPGETFDRGHVHDHVFEAHGTYEYRCVPHESVGMTGRVVVE